MSWDRHSRSLMGPSVMGPSVMGQALPDLGPDLGQALKPIGARTIKWRDKYVNGPEVLKGLVKFVSNNRLQSHGYNCVISGSTSLAILHSDSCQPR